MQFAGKLNALLLVLIVAPWLNPVVFGPTPSMVSWLVSASCFLGIGLLWWTAPTDKIRSGMIRPVMLGWLIAALLNCFIGLFQYAGHGDWLLPLANLGKAGEAYGNLRQRNQFATLTNIGLAVILFSPWSSATGRRRQLAWFALPVILLMAGNAASTSRTGLAQLLALLALSLWWGRARALVALAVVSYVAAQLLLPLLLGMEFMSSGLLGRMRENIAPCSSRLTLWANVLHLISLKPWTGWGWGELDYAHFITLYPAERFCDILDNAHNLPLHLAVELGVPVAAGVCLLLLYAVYRGRPWREAGPARQVCWTVLGLIGLHSLLEYPLWYGPFQMAAIVSVGYLGLHGCPRSPPLTNISALRPSSAGAVRRMIPGIVVGGLVGGALTYASWDYWRISQIYIAYDHRAPAYRDDTMMKILDSWLFRDAVRFAGLTTTPMDKSNAADMSQMGVELLHFSPEPRVAQIIIEGAVMAGREQQALFYLQRFKAAFPQEHARWAEKNRQPMRNPLTTP